MNVNSATVLEVRRYRRQFVGEFMDANPSVFAAPTSALSWIDFFAQSNAVEGVDRLSVERALGMFTHLFRQAQYSMLADAPMRIDEFLSADNFPNVEDILTPDPVALLIAGGEDLNDHTAETIAFARVMTVFKFLVRSGALPASHIYEAMCSGLSDLPSNSPVQRSLADAVRQMVQRDVETMLDQE